MQRSWLEIVSGHTGETLKTTDKVADYCSSTLFDIWRHWQVGGVMFGASSDTIVMHHQGSQTETTRGEIWVNGGNLSREPWRYYHPSNPWWDTYTQAMIPFGGLPGSAKWVSGSGQPNGLIMTYNNIERLVCFSSGRAYEYNVQAFGLDQLRADCPFLGNSSSSGRTYGLVCTDPMSPTRVVAVAGGTMLAYLHDALSDAIEHDLYSGVERHITSYNVSTNTVDNRWIGSAFLDGMLVNVVRFPAHVLLPSTGSQSHVVFNKYSTGGHWNMIVTAAGTVTQNALMVCRRNRMGLPRH